MYILNNKNILTHFVSTAYLSKYVVYLFILDYHPKSRQLHLIINLSLIKKLSFL